jgi:hypothetical protein
MKSRALTCRLASFVLAALCVAAFAVPGVRAQSASTPELKSVEPKDVKALIAANKGKVVFLNFFATYCVPCHTELQEQKPPFAVYIASSTDDDFYKAIDPRWASMGEGLPMTTIYDRDGKEAHFYQKALSLADMEHDVTPLLGPSH